MSQPEQKSVLLIIGGGIAAYKSLELIRQFKAQGWSVQVVMTKASEEFITHLSAAALSGREVRSDLFDQSSETAMGHIELSRSADLIVVAPATADLMAKMAQGLAGDLASTLLLASNKPILIAPAMNVRMWLHPATQRNLEVLRRDGVLIVGPDVGDMACGETGPGRMAEAVEILQAMKKMLASLADKPLRGKRVLVTAGPTREPIDPVRYISNHSSGKQGYAIAAAAAELGAETILVSGPVALAPPPGVTLVKIETAQEMLVACEAALPCYMAICVAAVADWRVADVAPLKLKKNKTTPAALMLIENPDILKTLSHHAQRPDIVVGFAAETNDILAHARAKLIAKGCDLIVANDVGTASGVFGGELNQVHLVSAEGVESWEAQSKTEIARRLLERLAGLEEL